MADSTLFPAPSDVPDRLLVLMADIFPTGFFGARNAFKDFTPEQASESTCVVLGCGPVGLCTLVNVLDLKPKHLFAVDAVDSRLGLAKILGAEPLNFKTDEEGLKKRIKEVTDGRGADVVIEVVGLSMALRLAFDLVRPWGVISSIGVHNAEVRRLSVYPTIARAKMTTDSLVGQGRLRQKLTVPAGPLPSAVDIPRCFRGTAKEAPYA